MLALLNKGIDYLQAKFPPNRVVVFLTPLVFAPAAGWISTYVAEHFAGLQLDSGVVLGIFATGALSAVGLAYKFVDGWQKAEGRGDV